MLKFRDVPSMESFAKHEADGKANMRIGAKWLEISYHESKPNSNWMEYRYDGREIDRAVAQQLIAKATA